MPCDSQRRSFGASTPSGKRLFIGRQGGVMVVEPKCGEVLGEVTEINGARGLAIAEKAGCGFATSGRYGSMVMFDLMSPKVLGRTDSAEDVDTIMEHK